MKTQERIAAFQKLGIRLSAIDEVELTEIAGKAVNENPWFTPKSIRTAFAGLARLLNADDLSAWTSRYKLAPAHPKVVAVVTAGNIPLVGFHDLLCVLVSGHNVQVKPSSRDLELLKFIVRELISIEPRFEPQIEIVDQLRNFDAVIATGSDNSARYFHYYFDKYPNIIRKNRTSCAVIDANETDEALIALGEDIFTYYGLGCRNVSKLFVPPEFDIQRLAGLLKSYDWVLHHHKYHNNYDYQKSILIVNQIPFVDTGFLLLTESEKLVSPISVLYYETYRDDGDLALKLTQVKDKLQCIVGEKHPAGVPFGQAQSPCVWDYADQVDTLAFLDSLS